MKLYILFVAKIPLIPPEHTLFGYVGMEFTRSM